MALDYSDKIFISCDVMSVDSFKPCHFTSAETDRSLSVKRGISIKTSYPSMPSIILTIIEEAKVDYFNIVTLIFIRLIVSVTNVIPVPG